MKARDNINNLSFTNLEIDSIRTSYKSEKYPIENYSSFLYLSL